MFRQLLDEDLPKEKTWLVLAKEREREHIVHQLGRFTVT